MNLLSHLQQEFYTDHKNTNNKTAFSTYVTRIYRFFLCIAIVHNTYEYFSVSFPNNETTGRRE